MPEQSINEQTRQMMDMPTSGDPAIIDPTTGRPYTPDASMRQQEEITRQAGVKEEFVSEQRLQLPKDLEEEIEKEIRPKARPEGLPNVYEKNTAIDKTLEYGYLLKERQPGAKGKTRIVTGLDEKNPAHQRVIKAFFDSAVGGDTGFDPTKQAWCAAFVNHILTEMGADLIESKDPYKRLRANEYKTYGKPVDLKNIQEGDIVVFDFNKDGTADHVTFYAGGRITSQGEGQYINVIGGNQGGGEVSIRENEPGYTLDNVAAIRRVTYDGDAYEIAQSHKDSDPIFKTFLPEEHEDYALNLQGNYNEGGAVMNEQMEMAFMQQGGLKDDGIKRDPVSGNEVPNGSMAKEVRDDIPAQLSEGEYVVPADVVRYLGVKHFEDLRDKAKSGLQKMEANGRIGGEPVPVGGPQAAPMMQPPMPQAPTPYSPQPAPPQMAMGGDLSPEEMNEINSIMMAQGGMVPTDPYQQQQMQYTQPMAMGAAEGTDVTTGGFYNPGGGLTTEQTITTPGPLGGGKYTGEFSTETPQVGITDTEVPVENEASCEARGLVYNPDTKMCETPAPVPERVGGDGSSSTPPTTPGTPGTPGSFDVGFKNWGSEVDWTDPESVEKFVTGQYNMPDPALRKGAGVAGLLGAGPLAAVGTVGSIFMAGQVLDTVADLRTSVMIAKAYGNTEGAAIAQAKLDAALKGAPSYVTSSFGDIVAPGTRQFAGHVSGASGLDDLPSDIDAWTENDFTRFQSAVGKKAPVKPEPTRSNDDRPTVVPGTPPPSAAGTGGAAAPPRRPTGDDPGPSGTEVAAKASQASTATPASKAKAMSAARQKGGISASTAAKLSGSQMKAGSGVGSGAGGSNYAGPMNKGGLMKKKRKK